MIPNIFISSTIQDLLHLRDGVRDAIVELSCNPVMSEYGEVGYLPSTTAEDSCYLTVKECQLAIILIGKRYGHISENGFSVTHNEFKTAKACRIPIITLVDVEVMAFKKIYDSNPKKRDLQAPGMDNPRKTFEFINEISSSQFNNGILIYSHASDARMHLKKQLAHLFGEFLRGQFNPVKTEIRDVLSEIKTLRHEIVAQKKGKIIDIDYLSTIRFLLEDRVEPYRSFVLAVHGGRIDDVIPNLKDCKSIKDFIQKETGSIPKVIDVISQKNFKRFVKKKELSCTLIQAHFPTYDATEYGLLTYFMARDRKITINTYGLRAMNSYHEAFLRAVAGVPIDEI